MGASKCISAKNMSPMTLRNALQFTTDFITLQNDWGKACLTSLRISILEIHSVLYFANQFRKKQHGFYLSIKLISIAWVTHCIENNYTIMNLKPLSYQTAMLQRLYSVLKVCLCTVGSPRNIKQIKLTSYSVHTTSSQRPYNIPKAFMTL